MYFAGICFPWTHDSKETWLSSLAGSDNFFVVAFNLRLLLFKFFQFTLNVRISEHNSGCLSLSLQELTSLQGFSYNWSCCGRTYGKTYTLLVAAGKSSPPRLARTTLSLLRLRIRVLIISVTIRRLLGKGESQNDTPTRSFQRGFYSERRQEQKPTTINFHPFVTAVDKVANRVKIHHVGTFEIFFCDTCSFSLCRRALPQVSVAW